MNDELRELLDVLSGPAGWLADMERLIAQIEREAERRGILRGRLAEAELLATIAQDDDGLSPDEYEAMLTILNARLEELRSSDYRKNPTWTV